jgi:hypothetical protein
MVEMLKKMDFRLIFILLKMRCLQSNFTNFKK